MTMVPAPNQGGSEGAPTGGREVLPAATRSARGGEVPRPANGHRWLPSFRAREALESREGTPAENARRLFMRADAMSQMLLESGALPADLFVVAREDTPETFGLGYTTILLAWVPGEGFALMVREDGESHVLETYRSCEELARGQLPYRLLVAAVRTLLAEDAGPRLLRMQENERRLEEWEREGADRSEPMAPMVDL